MILQHLTFLEEALSATSILKAKEPYELVIYKRFCLLAIFFLHLIVHRLYIEVGIKGSFITKKRTIVFAIRRDLSRASKVPSLVGAAEESRVLWYSFVCCAFHFAEDRVHREREITPQFFK